MSDVVHRSRSAGQGSSGIRKLPLFRELLGAVVLGAKEAIIAPLRPILREFDLTEPQWRVMRVINDQAANDATGIADVALLRAPSVTRILKELEERGLIEREVDTSDRRRTIVVLSPAGKDIVATTSRTMVRILRDYADRFGPDRLERLQQELRALTEAIKGAR